MLQRVHVLLLPPCFRLFPLLLVGLLLLAPGLLLGQDSGLRVSVWLCAAVIKLADLLVPCLFPLDVVVSEADDFLADLVG